MPRYGLVKYDYNCLLNNYEIVKKKKMYNWIRFISFFLNLSLFVYIVFSPFVFFFHTFTLHSFHPKSYNVSKFIFSRLSNEYDRSLSVLRVLYS